MIVVRRCVCPLYRWWWWWCAFHPYIPSSFPSLHARIPRVYPALHPSCYPFGVGFVPPLRFARFARSCNAMFPSAAGRACVPRTTLTVNLNFPSVIFISDPLPHLLLLLLLLLLAHCITLSRPFGPWFNSGFARWWCTLGHTLSLSERVVSALCMCMCVCGISVVFFLPLRGSLSLALLRRAILVLYVLFL